MFKKKKKNESDEYLMKHEPLEYCKKTFKPGMLLNNSDLHDLLKKRFTNHMIQNDFSFIQKTDGIYCKHIDSKKVERHYMLYNFNKKMYAEIIDLN